MDRLSSCYFCGAALDATLEERPVVPSELHPSTDSQKTVVLCLTCQRKLGAVLDTVLDAVEAGAADVAPSSGTTDADRTPAERTGGDASTQGSPASDDLESTLGDDEDILAPIGEDDDAADEDPADATAAADDSDGDPADRSADDRSEKPKYTRSRGAGFRREDDGPVETGSLTGGAFSDDDDDEPSDSGSVAGDASAGDERGDAGGSGSSGPSASGSQSGGTADSGSTPADDTGDNSADDGGRSSADDAASGQRDVSMTRLENTKVMRLLENREFPVDRDEFVTVAANAYQVSREDCDKVIDLAVEHDLLREENGQLYGGDA